MITLDSLTNNQTIDIIKNKYGLNNGYVFNDYLPDSVVIFIDRLGKMLKDNNVPHYFESGDNIVGFRFDINRRFFCYINTDFYGDYYIHIYNKRTNENSRILFDSQLTDKYLADILFISFQFSDIARRIKPNLAISTKGWGYHFNELLDEYDSDPSSFNEIFKHLENKGFIYTEDDEHIYFYLKEDLNNDIKKPWFTFYKKRFFGPDYEGAYSYYDALAISYSLAPGEKELHRYARFPLANKVNHIIELIDKVMYHRHILRYLLSHSVYGNIIRCSNGYEDSFPSDFSNIQKHINYDNDHNEFISALNGENYKKGIYKYADAVSYYTSYKYQILKEAIMDNCINMSLNQEITDMYEFDKSLYECIKNNDYGLCSIRGVTTKFLKVLNDDYYDLTKLFVKYDCESIKEL